MSSVASRVKEYVPAVVGVPVIMLPDRDRPGGSMLPGINVHVMVPVPVAERVAE